MRTMKFLKLRSLLGKCDAARTRWQPGPLLSGDYLSDSEAGGKLSEIDKRSRHRRVKVRTQTSSAVYCVSKLQMFQVPGFL